MKIHVSFRFNKTGIKGDGEYGSAILDSKETSFPISVAEFTRLKNELHKTSGASKLAVLNIFPLKD